MKLIQENTDSEVFKLILHEEQQKNNKLKVEL